MRGVWYVVNKTRGGRQYVSVLTVKLVSVLGAALRLTTPRSTFDVKSILFFKSFEFMNYFFQKFY
jgi:hypothetical protein